MSFASMLTDRKVQLHKTNRGLSEATGLPASHISTVLTGKKDAQSGTIALIADALDAKWVLIPKHLMPEVERLLSGKQIGPDDVPSTMDSLFAKESTGDAS